MSRRLLGPLAVLVGALAWAPTAPAQVVVLTAKSAGATLDDLRYLVGAVLPEDQARPALDVLERFKDPAVTRGLDRARPLGAYVDLPKEPGQQPAIVGFVPVSDGPAFLKTLEAQGFTVDNQPAAPGFSHQVTPPGAGGPPVFALLTADYAFFTNDAGAAPGLKALKPADLLPGRPDAGLLSLDLRLDRVPAQYKELVLQQVAQNAEKDRAQRDGEDDATYQGRLAGQQLALDGFNALIRDGKGITLDLGVDPGPGELVINLGMQATPGSPTAASLRTFGARTSLFHDLGLDSALSYWASLPLSEPIRAALAKAFAQGRKSIVEDEDNDDATKQLATTLFDAIAPTFQADDVDLGMAIRGPFPKPGADPLYVLLAGLKVKDGKKIEAILRDAIAKSGPEIRAQVALDLEKAGDGVTSIHRLRIDEDDDDDDDKAKDKKADEDKDDDKAKGNKAEKADDDKDDDDDKAKARVAKQFGEPFVYFALRDDVAIAALGENGLNVVKEALDATARPAAEHPSQVELVASLAKLAGLGDDPGSTATRDAAAAFFRGPAAKKDGFRFRLRGEGDSARLRYAIDVPVLKFLAEVGIRRQQGKADDR